MSAVGWSIVSGFAGAILGAIAVGATSARTRQEAETRAERYAEFIEQFGLDSDEVADLENLSGHAPDPAEIAAKVQKRWMP